MDIVTHLAAGALGGQILRAPGQRDRHLLVFCALAAWLPDIDNFIGLFGTEFYLRYHRGFTHSIIGSLILSALLAGVFALRVKSLSFWKALGLGYACALLHIYLDVITSYGTLIFMPFSSARISVPCLFIVDPIFTAALLILLFIPFRKVNWRKSLAMAGMAWIFFYPGLNLGVRSVVQWSLESRLRHNGVNFARMDITTEAFSPFLWKVILEDDATYRMSGVNVLQLKRPLAFSEYAKADRALLEQLGRQVSLFATYAWFTDYIVMRREVNGAETTITFSDLKFFNTAPFLKGFMREGEAPFTLKAVLDADGQLRQYRYHEGPGTSETVKIVEEKTF